MEFKNIIYINGKSGLFELVGNKSNGVIAKSITDGLTQFYSSRIYQFTPLNSIEMFTHNDNVPLAEIMQAAKNILNECPPVDPNADNTTLKNYFKKVLPNFDEDRVKISDIKKFIKWFAICKDMDFATETITEKITETAATPVVAETKSEATVEEKPAKKAAKKKSTESETTSPTSLFGEETQPVKKTKTTKKKAQ